MKKLITLLTVLFLPVFLFSQNAFKKWFGTPSSYDNVATVIVLPDGYLTGGETGTAGNNYDFQITRFDSDGSLLWNKILITEEYEILHSLAAAADGGFFLGGTRGPFQNGQTGNGLLVKTDNQGEEQWHLELGYGIVEDIAATADGTLVVMRNSFFKIDLAGNIVWETLYYLDNAGVIPVNDGSIYFGFDPDIGSLFTHFDHDGQQSWSITYTDDSNGNADPLFLIEAVASQNGDGFYLLGFGLTTTLLTKIDMDGNVEWQTTVIDDPYAPLPNELAHLSNGQVIFIGNSYLAKASDQDGSIIEILLQDDVIDSEGFFLSREMVSDGPNLILTGRYGKDIYHEDGFLFKSNSLLEKEWMAIIGDENPSHRDKGWSVLQTHDGGYLLTGERAFPSKDNDVYVVKTDPAGNITWETNIGSDMREVSYSVSALSDGNYLVTGLADDVLDSVSHHLLVYKIDNDGNFLWEQSFAYPSDHFYPETFGVEMPDGNLSIMYTSKSPARANLVRTDANGNKVWEKTYTTLSTRINSLEVMSDGSLLATGSGPVGGRGLVLKIDAAGEQAFDLNIDGLGNGGSNAYSSLETANGDYLVTGVHKFNSSSPDSVYIIKMSPQGETVWEKFFAFEQSKLIRSFLTPAGNGHFFLTTSAWLNYNATTPGENNLIHLMKFDNEGNEIWRQNIGSDLIGECIFHTNSTSDGGVVMTGDVSVENTQDILLIKVLSDGSVSTSFVQDQWHLSIAPNPSNGQLQVEFQSDYMGEIKITVLNAQGQLMADFKMQKRSEFFSCQQDLHHLPTGHYYVRLEAAGRQISSTWIKQ
ncbi:MAG: T9SS type A sorting domain-containing protein [Bacteroidota bacterium]